MYMLCQVLKVLFICCEEAKCQNGHQFYTVSVMLYVLSCLKSVVYLSWTGEMSKCPPVFFLLSVLYVLSVLKSVVCLSWTDKMSKCPPVLHCHCHVICSVMSWKCCLSVMNRQNVKTPTSFTLSLSCYMFCHVLKVLFVCREQVKCQNAHQFYTVILCVLPCLEGNIGVCLLRIVEIFCS